MPLRNLALRRPARQSSTSPFSTDPSPAVDAGVAVSGDLTSPRFFHTQEEFFPWWQADLGGEFLLSRVEILDRTDASEPLQHYTLMGSLCGESWLPLRSVGARQAPRRVIDFEPMQLARYLRVRLDGRGSLHFRQCIALGEAGDASPQRAAYRAAAAAREARGGRNGGIARVGGFDLFIDDAYGEAVKKALRAGNYELKERALACRLLRADDRVVEAGTAVGLVAMTAAAIIGAEKVVTFDANPAMTADAQANFARNGLPIVARCGALAPRSRFFPGQQLAFHVARDFWGSRLVANTEDGTSVIQVPTFCFESECERVGATVLICDIEGGEIDLLMTANLYGLRLIILETHDWAVGQARTDALIRKLILDGFALDLDATSHGVATLRR